MGFTLLAISYSAFTADRASLALIAVAVKGRKWYDYWSSLWTPSRTKIVQLFSSSCGRTCHMVGQCNHHKLDRKIGLGWDRLGYSFLSPAFKLPRACKNVYIIFGLSNYVASCRRDDVGLLYFLETKCMNLNQRTLKCFEKKRSQCPFHVRAVEQLEDHMIISFEAEWTTYDIQDWLA